MDITCPRCGFKGEAAFEFKTNPMFALLKERLGGGGSSSTNRSTIQDEEMGEYTVCPRCISVYAVTTGASPARSEVRWSGTQALSVPTLHREYQLTLLTAERLRRFSPDAQERLRSRMETYFKAHRDSQMRQDAIEYLQKYIIEYLRMEERQRMRLSDLTFSFVALSEGHPFYEALARLQSRGRVHTFAEEGSSGESGGETTVMLV